MNPIGIPKQSETKGKATVPHGLESHYKYKLSDNSSLALDFIRAGAAQMVLIGHGMSLFGIAKNFHEPSFPFIQNIAVIVFFILSGFLITYSTSRKRHQPGYCFTAFTIERFGRIYSGYLPAIFFVILLDLLFIRLYGGQAYDHPLDFRTILGNLLQLQDYPVAPSFLSVTSLGSARTFWTIAIEWWIYILFGAVVFCDFSLKGIAKYSAVFAIAGIVATWNSVFPGRGYGLFIVWLMGASLAFLSDTNNNLTLRKSGLISVTFLVAGCLRVLLTKDAYDLPFAAFLTIALFFLIRFLDLTIYSSSVCLRTVIRFAANYSFTLYLVHYSILAFMAPLTNTFSPQHCFFGCILASNVIAALLALVTEMKHRQFTSFLLRRAGVQF